MTAPRDRPPTAGLRPVELVGLLLLSLAIFLFEGGPIWRHPWHIDAGVGWSYLVLPAGVAALLAIGRRLSVRSFTLATIELVLAKFGLTYVIATCVWALAGEPPPPPRAVVEPTPAPKRHAATVASATPPGPEHQLAGRVLDASGAPRPGVLVYLAADVPGPSPHPGQVVELVNDGSGFLPRLAAVQVGQTVRARSTDGRLHTFRLFDAGGTTRLNRAVLAGGEPRSIVIDEPLGLATLRCTVHEREGRERDAHLLVTAHPFVAHSAADGTFQLAAPAAPTKVRLLAFDEALGSAEKDIEGTPSGQIELRLGASAAGRR
jgi:hypothetical protein